MFRNQTENPYETDYKESIKGRVNSVVNISNIDSLRRKKEVEKFIPQSLN